ASRAACPPTWSRSRRARSGRWRTRRAWRRRTSTRCWSARCWSVPPTRPPPCATSPRSPAPPADGPRRQGDGGSALGWADGRGVGAEPGDVVVVHRAPALAPRPRRLAVVERDTEPVETLVPPGAVARALPELGEGVGEREPGAVGDRGELEAQAVV